VSDELIELKKISKTLTLANAEAIENELSKYATTDERKRLWVLIDGQKKAKELAQSLGLTEKAVYNFLKVLEIAELVDNPWGKAPKKLLDFVPASWVELTKVEETKKEEKTGEVE